MGLACQSTPSWQTQTPLSCVHAWIFIVHGKQTVLCMPGTVREGVLIRNKALQSSRRPWRGNGEGRVITTRGIKTSLPRHLQVQVDLRAPSGLGRCCKGGAGGGTILRAPATARPWRTSDALLALQPRPPATTISHGWAEQSRIGAASKSRIREKLAVMGDHAHELAGTALPSHDCRTSLSRGHDERAMNKTS